MWLWGDWQQVSTYQVSVLRDHGWTGRHVTGQALDRTNGWTDLSCDDGLNPLDQLIWAVLV